MSLPRIDPRELLRVVNRHLNHRDSDGGSELSNSPDGTWNRIRGRRLTYASPLRKSGKSYTIRDFLDHLDREFVVNVYRGLLRRSPDPEGLRHYLEQLRSGRLNQIEIIGRIRYSKEGRREGVPVKGLMFPFSLSIVYRVPMLGYLIRLVVSLLRLPKILNDIRQYQVFANRRFLESAETVDSVLDVIATELESHESKLAQTLVEFDELTELVGALRNSQEHAHEELRSRLHRVSFDVEDAVKKVQKIDTELQKVTTQRHCPDDLYLAFENKYRGSEEDISNRLQVYVPLVREAKESTDGELRAVDLGSGRGEWLTVLRDHGMEPIGVDVNASMVHHASGLGFHVVQKDALTFLREAENDSLGLVTGFHIIEHMPFSDVIALFDECLRVLRPGGIVIFETPNPENILVSAHTFHMDPTHVSPIVPDTIHFIAEHRGFVHVEILRLHKREEPEYVGNKFVDEVLYKFNMERDFAVVGRKMKLT